MKPRKSGPLKSYWFNNSRADRSIKIFSGLMSERLQRIIELAEKWED